MSNGNAIGGKHPAPRTEGGFTLLEALTAVAITVILATIALPTFTNLVRNSQTRTATSDIFTALAYARSEAVKRNGNVTIESTSGDWLNGWAIKDGDTVLRFQPALPGKIASVSATDGSDNAVSTLTFSRDGRVVSASDIRFRISATGATLRCVEVRSSGTPQVRVDHNGDGNCSNG